MPKRWKLAEGGLPLLVYIIESVRLFVCLFAVNAKTTARIDAKRSVITKNDPESVLCMLKSPVLVFLGKYRDISGFSFRSMSALVKRRGPCATSVLFHH